MKKLLIILVLMITGISILSFTFADKLDEAYALGERWGTESGRVYGYRDLVNENENDWYKAYLEVYPDDESIIEFFNLDEDEEDYNDAFVRGLRDSFYHGYKAGYENIIESDEDALSATLDAASEHGDFFADLDGRRDGILAFKSGKDNNPSDFISGDGNIISKYNLNKESQDYRNEFLKTYKKQYFIYFNEYYREANNETVSSKESNAYTQGYELGTIAGESNGMKDLMAGYDSDWEKSFIAFENELNVFTRYNLYRQSKAYYDTFMAAFKIAYEIGYNEMYQETNAEIESNNINYRKITTDEMTLEFSSYDVEFINGSKSTTNKIPLYLEFPAGSTYDIDTFISISENQRQFLGLNGKKPATPIYEIKVINDHHALNLEKNVKLVFNFIGNSKAGIYKFVNGQWMYLDTQYKNETLSTIIPKGELKGGLYAVLFDDSYRPMNEYALHWGYRDIRTFLKRGYIQGDYDVELPVSRKEFSKMIFENTYGSYHLEYNSEIEFADRNYFGTYENAINFMVNKGYMLGVGSNLFDPNGYITYKQVEIVMNRIMGGDFTWQEIENDMLIDRFHQSQANDYLSNSVPRSEIIYMLNNVLGDQVLFEE